MFENLSNRFQHVFRQLRGQGRLSESNIKEALKEVRNSLLEADVSLEVVTHFISRVKKRALGLEVSKSLNPGQAFIKLVKRELEQLLGETAVELNLRTQPPAVILMAGLQGSGKTTSTLKLARYLKDQLKKKVMVVSVDVYRPAAILQLQTLAEEFGISYWPSSEKEAPLKIAQAALDKAKRDFMDVLIVDTAGRLHLDDAMMSEVKSLHTNLNPIETLFVADSMMGQEAANIAKVFHDTLGLTGVILTKIDGDMRGGAALSIVHMTGQPIKFLGVGEKTDALEVFHPDRIVSRILGMGDVLSLIEHVEKNVDKAKAEKLVKKIQKGDGFSYQDFLDQLDAMDKMGGMGALLSKMPGMGQLPQAVKEQAAQQDFKHQKAIIQSMTQAERLNPDLINPSRKKRLAQGSGRDIQEVNRLIKRFEQMQKMMQKMGKPGALTGMMRGLSALKGGFPGGFPG